MLDKELDKELSAVLGVNHQWTSYISDRVKRCTRFLVDDQVADAISSLYYECNSNNKLKESLDKARQNSSDEKQLVSNTQNIICRFVDYSVKNHQRRWTHANKLTLFCNLEAEPVISNQIEDYDRLLNEYEESIIVKLKKMESTCENRQKNCIQLAMKIVPFYLRGESQKTLMERFQLNSKATFQKSLHIIKQLAKDNHG